MAHRPTESSRATVKAMAAYGIPQDDIASYLDIAPKTLRAHYRAELDKGATEANAKVAESLFRQATTGNVAAAIFWLKARAKWTERVEMTHWGHVTTSNEADISSVTQEELDQLERIAKRVSESSED